MAIPSIQTINSAFQEPANNNPSIQDLIEFVAGMWMNNPYGTMPHLTWLAVFQDLVNIQDYLKDPQHKPFPEPTPIAFLKPRNEMQKIKLAALDGQIKELEKQLAKSPSLDLVNKIEELEVKKWMVLTSV